MAVLRELVHVPSVGDYMHDGVRLVEILRYEKGRYECLDSKLYETVYVSPAELSIWTVIRTGG